MYNDIISKFAAAWTKIQREVLKKAKTIKPRFKPEIEAKERSKIRERKQCS